MDIDIDAYLGKQLYRRRRLLGLTQHQLGVAIGVTTQPRGVYSKASMPQSQHKS